MEVVEDVRGVRDVVVQATKGGQKGMNHHKTQARMKLWGCSHHLRRAADPPEKLLSAWLQTLFLGLHKTYAEFLLCLDLS